VDKIIKVEVALIVFYALAVSPRRSDFIRRKIVIHLIEVPERPAIVIDVNSIQDSWLPTTMKRPDAMKKMKNMMSDGKLCTTVHSECQIVAWISENLKHLPEVKLIPYVTCSKLHCLGCYTWLSSFNELNHPNLPSICCDGSHGKLQPGWVPPPLGPSYVQPMFSLLVAKVDAYFLKSAHSKEASASTMSDPQTRDSMIEGDSDAEDGKLCIICI
jgi:hypothetical protein